MDKLLQFIPLLAYYPNWLRWWFVILIGLILATIFLFIFYLPSAYKAEKQSIHIEFKNEPPFIYHELRRFDSKEQSLENWVYYYRVRLFNDSDENTVTVKDLKITDLEILEGEDFKTFPNFAPLTIGWESNETKTIAPKEPIYARFARVFPPDVQKLVDKKKSGKPEVPWLRFNVAPNQWPIMMQSNLLPGTYRFKLTAYFKNAPAVEAKFELKLSKQQDNVEELLKEIEIKML